MASLSDYLESGLLHHLFRGQTFPKPTNVAVALTEVYQQILTLDQPFQKFQAELTVQELDTRELILAIHLRLVTQSGNITQKSITQVAASLKMPQLSCLTKVLEVQLW